MNILKNLTVATLLATAALAYGPLSAQTTMPMKSMDMTSGEVKKIDKEAQKITLKHGEIKNMEMPGMTMVFKVQDAAMLDKVKTGDKVNFNVEKRDGAMVVTAIELAK